METATIYENTYWNHKGKDEKAIKALQSLIPTSGEVQDADKHPALERFRVASNCYYDLYNNGLCNRPEEFKALFGFDGPDFGEELTPTIVRLTEDGMDLIIQQATKEQASIRHIKALESIASLWPDPGMCAELVPAWVGPNDGRMRADTLWFALNTAREALGLPTYPRPEHWDK